MNEAIGARDWTMQKVMAALCGPVLPADDIWLK